MKWLLVAIALGLSVSGAAAQNAVGSNADIKAQLEQQKKFNALPLAEQQKIIDKAVQNVDELNALEAEPAPLPDDEPTFLDKMNEIDATHDEPCGVCDPITPRTPDGTYIVPRNLR